MVYVVGKTYMIDVGRHNSGAVILLRFGKNFGTVQDAETGAEWDVMLNRLSEVNDGK